MARACASTCTPRMSGRAGSSSTRRATSGTWSPILKRNLALASVEAELAHAGTELFIEWTVEWTRQTVPAVVRALPFFDPERKRSNPAKEPARSSAAPRAGIGNDGEVALASAQ